MYFFLLLRTLRLLECTFLATFISNIQQCYIYHVIHCIPSIYSFYNWKCISFDHLHPILSASTPRYWLPQMWSPMSFFLPFSRQSFHFVGGFLCCAETFQFDVVPFVYFCFCFPCLRRQIQNNITKIDVKEYIAYGFF